MRLTSCEEGWFHEWDNKENRFTIKKIAENIRLGNDYDFRDSNYQPCRLEALTWIAFHDTLKGFPPRASKLKKFVDRVSTILGEEQLLNMIENGGEEEYNKRQNLGFIR